MLRKEFEAALKPMCLQLGVKMNRFQQDHYFNEFGNQDLRDFQFACHELGFGKSGWLPDILKFRDHCLASWECRNDQKKLKREKDLEHSHQVGFTVEERLQANRAANEVSRQIKARETLDSEKVKAAIMDPSKDEEIKSKYSGEAPNPGRIFGSSPKELSERP